MQGAPNLAVWSFAPAVVGTWLVLALFGQASAECDTCDMFQVRTSQSMPVFDPRIAGDRLLYSPIDGRVMIDGDISLGTVADVHRNSWSLAISAARVALDDKYQAVMARLTPTQREEIKGLSLRKLTDLQDAQAEQMVQDAIRMLRPLQEFRVNFDETEPQRQAAAIFAGAENEFRWPGGKIPYVLSPEYNQQEYLMEQKALIEQAVDHWNVMTGRSVELFPLPEADREKTKNYILFHQAIFECYSECVGKRPTGGVQKVGLALGCRPQQIIHEIGHVVGLFHEQNRKDRKDWIIIHEENMVEHAEKQFGGVQWVMDIGPFDFDSIMLYPSRAFSKNGQPTIVRKDNPSSHDWGLRTGNLDGKTTGLSAGDIAAVKLMYPKKQ
jgi:hypothetical protein